MLENTNEALLRIVWKKYLNCMDIFFNKKFTHCVLWNIRHVFKKSIHMCTRKFIFTTVIWIEKKGKIKYKKVNWRTKKGRKVWKKGRKIIRWNKNKKGNKTKEYKQKPMNDLKRLKKTILCSLVWNKDEIA